MNTIKHTASTFEKRQNRVRAKIKNTMTRLRLTVFRSNRFMYLQVLDLSGKVIASANDSQLQKATKKGEEITKTQGAVQAATVLAGLLKKKHVTSLVLDRGAYRYHGRVKAVAETLRELGMQL